MAEQEMLTLKEAAEWLRVSERTIYNLMQRKVLKGAKVGNQWRFRKATLEAYIQKLEEIPFEEKELTPI